MLNIENLRTQFIADNLDINIEIDLFKIRKRKDQLLIKIDDEMRIPEFERREVQLLTAKEESLLKRKAEQLDRLDKEWSKLLERGFK